MIPKIEELLNEARQNQKDAAKLLRIGFPKFSALFASYSIFYVAYRLFIELQDRNTIEDLEIIDNIEEKEAREILSLSRKFLKVVGKYSDKLFMDE